MDDVRCEEYMVLWNTARAPHGLPNAVKSKGDI